MIEEELEKEAEKYLDEKCKDCYMCSYDEHKDPYRVCQRRKDRKQAYLAGAEPREMLIVELKGLVNQYKSSKCSGISMVNRNMIMSDQLVKAKEIIKDFVEWANWQSNSECPSFKSIQHKAEQFLSEVEK